jgi:hypothetical protein
MTSKKKHIKILVLVHFLEFVFVSGIMYIVYSKLGMNNEALTTIDHAKNAEMALLIGLLCAIPGFLIWYYYLLPKILGKEA